jgi:hypothetical protein
VNCFVPVHNGVRATDDRLSKARRGLTYCGGLPHDGCPTGGLLGKLAGHDVCSTPWLHSRMLPQFYPKLFLDVTPNLILYCVDLVIGQTAFH